MKILFFIYFFVSCLLGQDYYGILGYRNFEIDGDCTVCNLGRYFGDSDETLYSIEPNDISIVLGMGYKQYKPYQSYNIFNSYFINHERYSMDFEASGANWFSDSDDDTWYWGIWSVGTGYGIVNKDGLTISANLEYNFAGIDISSDWDNYDLIVPKKNYLSFNISVGIKSFNKSIWSSPFGLHYSKPIKKHFINPNFGQVNGHDFNLEIPATWFVAGVGLVAYAAAISGTSNDTPNLGGGSSSSKGCHVYGKVRFVEYGEDYKVRFVSFGEDLKINYVDLLASSSGQWKVVEYGEDYKIRIVNYGEDFKVREVSFGEGCN